jgi:hypothetical protein
VRLSAPLRRLLLLGTAVVCLLGQATAFAHLALVRHATCPEHGRRPGARPRDARAAVAQAPEALTGSLPGRRVSAPPPGQGDDHDEDHCLMAAFRRGSLAAPDREAGQALPAPADPVLLPAQARTSRPGPVPLLLLAPKSSPPPALG